MLTVEAINRSVLGKIRGCEDDSILEGMCCTINCRRRNNCTVPRTGLLIHSNIISTKNISPETTEKLYSITVPISNLTEESYLNEIIGMVTNESASKHTARSLLYPE